MYITHTENIFDAIKYCIKQSPLKKATFSRSYPEEVVDTPTITFTILRRTPGMVGKERYSTRLIKVREGTNGRLVEQYGQPMTTTIQFDFFDSTDSEVSILMMQFESLIKEWKPLLMSMGIDYFLFEEQPVDRSLPVPKEIPVRSLRYSVVMRVIDAVSRTRIRQIRLSIAPGVSFESSAITRSISEDFDEVAVASYTICGLYKYEASIVSDYIADIDYTIEEVDANNSKIVWNQYGLHPSSGETYYMRYAPLSEPLLKIIDRQITDTE